MNRLSSFVFFILWTLQVDSQNHLPIGFLDYIDENGGYGWAYDAGAGTQAIDVHIYVDGRLYQVVTANQSRPDLVQAGVCPNPEHGFSFSFVGINMNLRHEVIVYAINFGGGANPSLTNTPAFVGTFYSGNATISNLAGPSPITITTTQRLAGAIHSLTWNGMEFIDSYDHGRQLQSATSFNNWGECFNPTEAGCNQDGTGNTSTSLLMYQQTQGNYMETQTLPAFWTQPGYTAPGCGYAINTTQRSSHYFRKRVTIGMPGMAHVIKYYTEYEIPVTDTFSSGVFEVTTGYMPSIFSQFYTYNPANQQLTPLSDGPGEQSLPVIFSTPNQLYAMGIYSPDLPQPNWNWVGYGRFRFPDCVKWNCVFREAPVYPGTYSYRSFVIVGSLQNVQESMNQLFDYFKISADFDAAPVCLGQPILLNDLTTGSNSETKYYWDIYNDGIIDDTTHGSISFLFPTSGAFSVRLRVVNGVDPQHQSEIVKTVTVFDLPHVTLNANDTDVCNGEEVELTASGACNYVWSTGSNYNPQSFYPGSTNTYYVTGTDVNGCSNVATLTITVHDLPEVSVMATDDTICVGQTTNLVGTPSGGIYSGTGVIGSVFNANSLSEGNYFVVYEYFDINGCSSNDTAWIYVKECTDILLNNVEELIYSNPASQFIEFYNVPERIMVFITDIPGRLILQTKISLTENTIDVSHLSNGIYLLKIKGTNYSCVKKVFVKNN